MLRISACVAIWLLASVNLAKPLEQGVASVDFGRKTPYDDADYHGRVASGERFSLYSMTAGHRTLPFGTIAMVDYPQGWRAYVRINERGPCLSLYCQKRRPDLLKRIVDLTPEAADAIKLPGLGRVILRVCKIYKVSIGPGTIPLRTCS